MKEAAPRVRTLLVRRNVVWSTNIYYLKAAASLTLQEMRETATLSRRIMKSPVVGYSSACSPSFVSKLNSATRFRNLQEVIYS